MTSGTCKIIKAVFVRAQCAVDLTRTVRSIEKGGTDESVRHDKTKYLQLHMMAVSCSKLVATLISDLTHRLRTRPSFQRQLCNSILCRCKIAGTYVIQAGSVTSYVTLFPFSFYPSLFPSLVVAAFSFDCRPSQFLLDWIECSL